MLNLDPGGAQVGLECVSRRVQEQVSATERHVQAWVNRCGTSTVKWVSQTDAHGGCRVMCDTSCEKVR
ncbi:hypothetical protein MA16_Dca027255 [Dendrobium catenatum]|uniref:Uncharacterized protein n=1 Tax=Dendrobium catenatum TaxID=906689 RepID=A0A2I0VPM0_9ASPA|nr:hypothetical protein MA16_Dca027255 [Dendrobium catenatum]